MEKVFIVSALRSPIGSFGGQFRTLSAIDLGAQTLKAALAQSQIAPDHIDEVLIGNVLSANLGQAPAKQVARSSHLPDAIPATVINKVCASGAKAIMLGAQSIQLGQNQVVIAGGMESMSNVPFYVPQARFGYKYGSATLVDGLEKDGLQDAYNFKAMGVIGDQTAEKYQISRETQDEFAIQSYKKVAQASAAQIFQKEIAPISVPQRKGSPLTIDTDEEFSRVNFEKIPMLKPAFSPEGTVTAANASTLNDGASMLVLASGSFVQAHGIPVLAEVISYGDAAQAPEWFTTSPIPAAKRALERAKLSTTDINLFEVNEAFSVVPLVFAYEQKIDLDKINIHGGAVAMGHPLGASGARIVTTLVNALNTKQEEWGCASICNGGGGASAIVIKKV